MGSKARIASNIAPILMELYHQNECEVFIDCTVGGANLLEAIPESIPRYGIDNNEYLIEMWQAVSLGWMPPKTLTESDYKNIRDNKDQDKVLTGYVGFALSYGGKWFGGWCRGNKSNGEPRDYVDEAYRNASKQFPRLIGIHFMCKDFTTLRPLRKSLLYIDPPYKNTTKYKDSFDYDRMYDWCREMKSLGHTVVVSEYEMPEDFICIWSREISSSLTKNTGAKKGVEKLWIL